MKYRAFGDFRRGYAHVKNGSGVEDYASSYNDPEGRFCIGVICDGHSDQNCFRSSKGAQFGCETAVEVLTHFFDLYLKQKEENKNLPNGFETRLKNSIKQCWDRKVYRDIKENPLNEADLEPLTDRVRKIYSSGNGLLNIYGATFLAIGICEDFFISIHIGDGIILCADEDGSYFSPVPQDPKSNTGAPASLCDSDLFTRENAFRISVSKKIPVAAAVSSDGIEDCMTSFDYKRLICGVLKKMEQVEAEDQPVDKLNEKQEIFLGSCLDYYADKGHGAEDDCSLAVIYDLCRRIPDVKIPSNEATQLWESTVRERNEMVLDYERRKSILLKNMKQIQNSPNFNPHSNITVDMWVETHRRFEEQKRTLKTLITNEKEKAAFYDGQLKLYAEYIDNFSECEKELTKKLEIQSVDEGITEPDEDFEQFRRLRPEWEKKKEEYEKVKDDMSSLNPNKAVVVYTVKPTYEKAKKEFEDIDAQYQMIKDKIQKQYKTVNSPIFGKKDKLVGEDTTVPAQDRSTNDLSDIAAVKSNNQKRQKDPRDQSPNIQIWNCVVPKKKR